MYKLLALLALYSMYNNVLQPSKLFPGADFHCFKAGIEPKWEDPKCALGGKWTAQTPRNGGGKALLDTYWLHTVRFIFLGNGSHRRPLEKLRIRRSVQECRQLVNDLVESRLPRDRRVRILEKYTVWLYAGSDFYGGVHMNCVRGHSCWR